MVDFIETEMEALYGYSHGDIYVNVDTEAQYPWGFMNEVRIWFSLPVACVVQLLFAASDGRHERACVLFPCLQWECHHILVYF